MQFLTTALSLLSLSGAALGCTLMDRSPYVPMIWDDNRRGYASHDSTSPAQFQQATPSFRWLSYTLDMAVEEQIADLLTAYSTRYTVNFYSAEKASVDDQAKYNTACNEIKATIADFSAANENLYGSDFTSRFTGCDSGAAEDPRCYCSVTAWRYHEWQSTENKYELGAWAIKTDWTAIDSKTVDC